MPTIGSAGRKVRLPSFEDGPPGDRVACAALLSLICCAPAPAWHRGLPEMIAELASLGAGAARLAALDRKPAGWLALMGEAKRALGLPAAARRGAA